MSNQHNYQRIENHTDEKMEKFLLLDFSDEIFLEIFRNLSDVNLLTMAQVCKRFKEIAKDTVAKKYNGDSDEKYCDIRVDSGSEAETNEIYCQFFETFGSQITALKIFPGGDKNNHLLKLINRHCRFAKYIQIWSTDNGWWNKATCFYEQPKIPVTETICGMSDLRCLRLDSITCTNFLWTEWCYPQLETLNLYYTRNIHTKALHRFLISNPQLLHLKAENCWKFKLRDIEALKYQLNELKSLNFTCEDNALLHKCSEIKVENLEYLKITTDASSTANVLGVFGRGSKRIQNMIVTASSYDVEMDRTLEEFKGCIGLFDKLTSLKLYGFEVGNDLLEVLVQSLPNLTILQMSGIHLRDVTTKNILNAFRKGQQLKELKLRRKQLNNIRPLNIFDSAFHQKFAEIVRNRGSGIRFRFNQQHCFTKEKIIVTEEKIIQNGNIVYCVGYRKPLNQSNAHLYDLNDQVLGKICDYLNEQDHRALYETCIKTKNALQEQIKSQWFTISNEETAKDIFKRFGEHITKLEIDMNTKSAQQMTEIWKLISGKYSKNLVEMSINNVRVDAMGSAPMELPNLSKLIVKTMVSSSTHIFPLMNCPKLVHLEFGNGQISLTSKAAQFGITLTNLKTIWISHAKNDIKKVLDLLDDEICDQIKEFAVYLLLKKKREQISKMAMRFQNLTTFHYTTYCLKESNFEYLFKSCTKLKTLTIYVNVDPPQNWRRILEVIRDNCMYLEELVLYAYEEYQLEPCIPDAVALLPKVKLKIIFLRKNKYYLVGTNSNCQKPF